MAHFAQVNEDGSVGLVLVVADEDCGGGNFPESEPIGQAFLASLGLTGEWLQTSYSGSFRGVFAGGNITYDRINDTFVLPTTEESVEDETGI